MARVQNRLYNNPALGAAFENIASMFGPPDSSDLANWSLAKQRNQETSQIAQLFDLAQSPEFNQSVFDRMGMAAGRWTPTQSFYKVDTDDATARRGQDIDASTSLAANAADNRRAVVTNMFGALNPGQVRPALPADIASIYDLPALGAEQGNPKPLSESEWKAGELERLLGVGTITDDMLVQDFRGEQSPVMIDTPNGPMFEHPGAAIGQPAFVNKGAQAKPENAVALLRNGTRVPVVQQPDGRWVHAQTAEVMPPDIEIFKLPQAQGTSADIGLSKPTNTYIEKQLIDIATAKDTAVKLRDLIATAPASQGIVGMLRGTAQNIIQAGNELGQFFGGGVAEVAQDIQNGLADASLAGAFDPNIPAIEMMANLLAFQYAKTTTGERLSNEMLRSARAALGLEGLDANQANSIARLNQAIAQIESQEALLNRVREQGLGSISQPAPAAPGAASIEGVPPGWDPEDWKYLTPEEQQQVLSGN